MLMHYAFSRIHFLYSLMILINAIFCLADNHGIWNCFYTSKFTNQNQINSKNKFLNVSTDLSLIRTPQMTETIFAKKFFWGKP